MNKTLLKSKLHRINVTQVELDILLFGVVRVEALRPHWKIRRSSAPRLHIKQAYDQPLYKLLVMYSFAFVTLRHRLSQKQS